MTRPQEGEREYNVLYADNTPIEVTRYDKYREVCRTVQKQNVDDIRRELHFDETMEEFENQVRNMKRMMILQGTAIVCLSLGQLLPAIF